MRPTRGFLLACGAVGLMFAQTAPKKQLTARELFYAAAQAPAARTDTARPPAKRSTATPPKPVEIARADTRPPAPRTTAAVAQTTAPQPAPATAPMPAGGAPPLGLRYTVLKLAADNTPTEVPNDTVFHAGDRIRFSVEANAPGYLYIINQGSSGNWKPMFPSAEIEDGNNRIEGWRPYTMPPDLMDDLRRDTAGPEDDGVTAVHPMEQRVAARMRAVYARDLIIEKVDPNTPGDKKETAVYVVNPSGSADSRVVADLHLVHQ
ncbi:MAG: DUF4384 domain-containing protein [Candidatus Solibacter sp.]|nr:DUF4384 domain-containing protein [Candidatus Solibacter sp.]